MKYRSFILSFLIGTISILMSMCGNKTNYPAEVATLDSLTLEIKKTEESMQTMDTTLFDSLAKIVNENLLYYQTNNTDTIDRETGVYINNYFMLQNSLDAFSKKRQGFMKEMVYTKQQIEDLSHDLKNNLLEKEKALENYNTEVRKASELLQSAEMTKKLMSETVPLYDSLNPRMEGMLQKLKQEKDSLSQQ